MKKLIAIMMTLALLCVCAYAETGDAFTGRILTGTLPKEAELTRSEENAEGYIEELAYGDYTTIALACFGTTHGRDAYMDGYMPEDLIVCDDMPVICGEESTHWLFTTGENGDRVVNAYSFTADEHVYLFLVAVDTPAYDGCLDGDDTDYMSLIEGWIESLQLTAQE